MPLVTFGTRNQVPVMINQFGVFNTAQGQLQWLADMLGILEKHQIHWTYCTPLPCVYSAV
jgi:hypothetical protein